MTATVRFPGCLRRRFCMPLAEFLETPFMRRFARVSMCVPTEMVCDYLPEGAAMDDPEAFSLMVAEACEMATGLRVDAMALDDDGVLWFSPYLGWPPEPPTPAVAMAA